MCVFVCFVCIFADKNQSQSQVSVFLIEEVDGGRGAGRGGWYVLTALSVKQFRWSVFYCRHAGDCGMKRIGGNEVFTLKYVIFVKHLCDLRLNKW